jgi:SAM-dependent methyltransferase
VAGRECPLCGEAGTPVGTRDGAWLRLCCGSLLAWEWASEEEYETWYWDPVAYHVAEQRANGQAPFAERLAEQVAAAHARLQVLTALAPPRGEARLLDVGTGTGAFVEVARQYGYAATGIEPCGKLVEAAQQRNWPVLQGDWRSAAGRHAVITLFDVLEHLTRPYECLRHLRRCLEPEGVLVVEMPEWDSPHQRAHRMNWKHIRPRQHLWLPSRSAAELLYRRAGYELLGFYRPLLGSLGKASWFLTPSHA